MEPSFEYTVGTVAELTGVSIRTLHHYDEIGLLEPSARSAAGYRLYSDTDLQRLQRILFYRELDLGLPDITAVLTDSSIGDEDHLRRQRELLTAKITRYQSMIALIDKELTARRIGITLTPTERLLVLGIDKLIDRADEITEKWGHTPEFAQRRDRAIHYTKQDWETLRIEQATIHQHLADAMHAGTPATSPQVMDLAEQHRQHLHHWFHDCPYETHRQLATAYRTNQRSGLNYDDMAPGLSQYIHDAILANCRRHESDSADTA
ncbi:MerR family transcriptional regulator [Nocardia sp. NBC_01499]|uniref:MerR family transcriptional regulator n=1 Tax=Nocardia sp. NBC_01499 TaxID=2903597 RepID=UPI00386A950C